MMMLLLLLVAVVVELKYMIHNRSIGVDIE